MSQLLKGDTIEITFPQEINLSNLKIIKVKSDKTINKDKSVSFYDGDGSVSPANNKIILTSENSVSDHSYNEIQGDFLIAPKTTAKVSGFSIQTKRNGILIDQLLNYQTNYQVHDTN